MNTNQPIAGAQEAQKPADPQYVIRQSQANAILQQLAELPYRMVSHIIENFRGSVVPLEAPETNSPQSNQ